MNVALGVGGGIAAYKAAELARALMERGFTVDVVMTRAAEEFIRPLTFAALMLASRPEFGAVRTRDAQPIASTLSVLQERENDQGGFGLWSSSPQTAEFLQSLCW